MQRSDALRKNFHGAKRFFRELVIITLGLLIALALNDLVEWQQHGSLVRAAESSLRGEIQRNGKTLLSIRQQIQAEQTTLDGDLSVLAGIRANPSVLPHNKKLSFEFRIAGFEDTAWKTSQTTGAFAYMPYNEVEAFSEIYDTQNEVFAVEQQAVNDIMNAASPVITKGPNDKLTATEAEKVTESIGVIKMRLIYLDSLLDSLDKSYRKYTGRQASAHGSAPR